MEQGLLLVYFSAGFVFISSDAYFITRSQYRESFTFAFENDEGEGVYYTSESHSLSESTRKTQDCNNKSQSEQTRDDQLRGEQRSLHCQHPITRRSSPPNLEQLSAYCITL